MRSILVLLVLLVLALAPAAAQPAPKNDPQLETVIVTAPKIHVGVTPGAIAHDFVKSFAAPTALRDAIARWQTAICPAFEGLAPQYAAVMEARFRTIAGQAGAPMKEKGCRPNLSVVFTPQPQTYLDALHAKNADFLGYHGATIITHPIQVWYVTGITDIDGRTALDRDEAGTIEKNCGDRFKPMCWSQPTSVVGGWRFHPDATSDLLIVTVIVDTARIGPHPVGEIADYVAMLALSRTEDYDDCQLVPSIANLLSSNCDDNLKPSQITPTDIAYLRGVYKMDAGAALAIQQDQIAAEMAKVLASGK
jgi:hypothetical protein